MFGSYRWWLAVMVYLPSNGTPTLSTEMAAPACSFGLPRATPSNSAKALAICSAMALAVVSTSAWVRYATSVATYTGSPNLAAMSVGL